MVAVNAAVVVNGVGVRTTGEGEADGARVSRSGVLLPTVIRSVSVRLLTATGTVIGALPVMEAVIGQGGLSASHWSAWLNRAICCGAVSDMASVAVTPVLAVMGA